MIRVRTKFLLVFLISIMILASSSFYAIFFADKLSSELYKTAFVKNISEDAQLHSNDFNNVIRLYETSDKEKLAALKSEYDFSISEFRDAVMVLKNRKEFQENAAKLEENHAKYASIAEKIFVAKNEGLEKAENYDSLMQDIRETRHDVVAAAANSPERLKLDIAEIGYKEKEFNFQYEDKKHAEEWLEAIKTAKSDLGKSERELSSLLGAYSGLAQQAISQKNDLTDLQLKSRYYLGHLDNLAVENQIILSEIAKKMDTKLDKALAENNSKRELSFALILLLFVLGSMAIIRFSEYIAGSIEKLALASEKILRGRLDERVNIKSGDEIGYLAGVFNKMLDSINRKNEDLKEESSQLKAIVSSMDEGLLVLDTNFKVILINKTAAKMLKVSTEKIIGRNVEKLIKIFKGSFELPLEEWPASKTLKNGKPIITGIEEDIRFKGASGNIFPVEMISAPLVRSGITGVIIVFQDVSEKKLIEEEREFSRHNLESVLKSVYIERDNVQEEKNKLEAILNSIGDAVLAIDQNKKVVIFNPIAEKITGFKFDDIEGNPYDTHLKFVDELTKEKKTDAIDTALAGKIKEMSNNTALITKDSSMILVEISAAPIKNNKKENIGCIVVFRDVTEKREIERMRSDFISVVSHQLRTPLSAMKWFLEILTSGDVGILKLKQRELLKEISANNKNMIEFVNQMLNVSRIESNRLAINPEIINVDKAVQDILKEVIPFIREKRQTLKFKGLGDPSFKIRTDKSLLRNIIHSLLVNASRYTPDGGKINLEVKNENKKTLLFSVKDNGIGVPLKERHKIFKKFSRASNAIKYEASGTGIGLYIVKSIVDMIGAEIWFESEEGKGTTFFFTLPIDSVFCELENKKTSKKTKKKVLDK